ncbi:transposase [Klebsiella sp. 2680]
MRLVKVCIEKVECYAEHIHIFVDIPPKINGLGIMEYLKCISSL